MALRLCCGHSEFIYSKNILSRRPSQRQPSASSGRPASARGRAGLHAGLSRVASPLSAVSARASRRTALRRDVRLHVVTRLSRFHATHQDHPVRSGERAPGGRGTRPGTARPALAAASACRLALPAERTAAHCASHMRSRPLMARHGSCVAHKTKDMVAVAAERSAVSPAIPSGRPPNFV